MATQRRLDRQATERVLRRAVQLSDQPTDGGDTFDVEALMEAAAELGVASTAVERAVAEEQAGLLTQEPSRLDGLVGPAAVSAARVVPLHAADALELADEWLRRQWAFRRVRSGDTVAEYRRRTDMVASLQRTTRSMGGRENGDKVRKLRVIVSDLTAGGGVGSYDRHDRVGYDEATDAASSGDGAGAAAVIAVVVDLESSRSFAEMGGALVAGGGSLLSVIPAIGGPYWALLGVPASGAMGIGVLAARKVWTGGIDVALEGLLDRVEAGEPPPSVIGGIAERIKRTG